MLTSQADFSFGGRAQVLGLRGVRHAADGVGGTLGLAPNGLDTIDAVRLNDVVRRTGLRTLGQRGLATGPVRSNNRRRRRFALQRSQRRDQPS
jgi:hypothetical protein